jgi:hypothetical protein
VSTSYSFLRASVRTPAASSVGRITSSVCSHHRPHGLVALTTSVLASCRMFRRPQRSNNAGSFRPNSGSYPRAAHHSGAEFLVGDQPFVGHGQAWRRHRELYRYDCQYRRLQFVGKSLGRWSAFRYHLNFQSEPGYEFVYPHDLGIFLSSKRHLYVYRYRQRWHSDDNTQGDRESGQEPG